MEAQARYEAQTLGRFLAEEDRAQAKDEAREQFENDLLNDYPKFAMFAKDYMDDAGNLGSFLDFAWERHQRNQAPAHTRAWEDES
jgi:hypothetical protein